MHSRFDAYGNPFGVRHICDRLNLSSYYQFLHEYQQSELLVTACGSDRRGAGSKRFVA
ncbi:hypothetical protein H6G96_32215 [Nostoc sp. FACHB-892]|uniref:hypothetical protein n=1 Tax=Nostoc sp. FACHB-892 TaxID=2692843 RepID=UPI00168739DE|nr:hypothetical protein [Nostoc sp. FACHB-892]MBD2730858.1 hypothetical protein [Nostoc sp. FACHB-892]